MDSVQQQPYIEVLPMHELLPVQYLIAAQKAITKLHWQILDLDNGNANSIVFRINSNDHLDGTLSTIMIKDEKAVLYIMVTDDHENTIQHEKNAGLFKQAVIQVTEEQEKADRSKHPMHREKYGALVPSKTYLVTPIIIYINALIFIAMVCAGLSPLHPTAQSLYMWGGNFRPAVLHGDWWRLITYIFLHGGAMHILMNTYALLYIGMFLEPLLGRVRFISAYLLTGICAGLMSITMHPASVGVGASGAIFGMYGVFLSMLTTSHINKTMRKTMLRSILFFVVLNLLSGLQGNTDNAAHIGGLISGLLIGYTYYPGIAAKVPVKKQILVSGILACAVIVVSAVVMRLLYP
jgi:rhomboid protease GluP